MRRILIALALITLMMPILNASFAEGKRDMTAEQIVNEMRIGWNLGNTFDATGGDPEDVLSQEQSWGNPIVDEALIQRVLDAGFNTLRIPITWYRHVLNDGQYTINPAFIARIRQVVDFAYDRGMYVIINMHHEEWLNTPTMNQDYEQIGVQLAAMWKQIAHEFAGYDQRLIFESMNEPRMKGTSFEWNGNKTGYEAVNYLNQVFVDAIRNDAEGYNQTRLLMIPGYAASSSIGPMASIVLPSVNGETDPNLAISVHCYSPYDFCLSDKMTTFDPANKQHTNSIDTVFSNINKLFLSKGIPVVMGETSATNTNHNTDSREKWSYYMGAKAAEYGVPIVVWDNGNNQTSGGECHAWVRRSQNSKLRSQREPLPYPTVVQQLFAGAKSVEWGSGRTASTVVKSMMNGYLVWGNENGKASIRDEAIVTVQSESDWYHPGMRFAVIFHGEGTPNMILSAADQSLLIIPGTVQPFSGGKKLAWITYDEIVEVSKVYGGIELANLLSLSVFAGEGSVTLFEICIIGK